MIECRKKEVFYSGQPEEKIFYFALSPQGWLALSGEFEKNNYSSLRILDDKLQIVAEFPFVDYAVWSHDGEFLAIPHSMGARDQLAISDKFKSTYKIYPVQVDGVITWSPDNQYVMFQDRTTIKKLNLSNEEVTLICEDCYSPSWREIPATP